MGYLNAILAFSMESLEFPIDYFNEYSLTMGRQSQGVTSFKQNMLSMTDKSKKLSTKPDMSDNQKSMDIPEVFSIHQLVTDKSMQLCNQYQQELNSDQCSIFSNKKYKELMKVAQMQESSLCNQINSNWRLFTDSLNQLEILAHKRCQNKADKGQLSLGSFEVYK